MADLEWSEEWPGLRQRPSSREEIAKPSFRFRMSRKVATAVAAHDFQLTVDGFHDVAAEKERRIDSGY